jgi:thymidylate synthase
MQSLFKYYSGFTIISGINSLKGIGKNGCIPWKNKTDLQFFRDITLNNTVIMGRKTWDSLPKKPLNNRLNIIITTNKELKKIENENLLIANNLENAWQLHLIKGKIDTTAFIIGGEEIYKQALESGITNRIIISNIKDKTECDKYFPKIPDKFKLVDKYIEKDLDIDYYELECDNEKNYLKLLEKLLNQSYRENRTGVYTKSSFVETLRFDLTNNKLPLLTTKLVSFKTILVELLWFLRGDTNIEFLKENNVKIWDGNTSRKFLDKQGLNNFKVGELGAGYGFRWKHFGAVYRPESERSGNYIPGGIDQIENVINSIKTDPYSRRHIVSAIDPIADTQVALPPCHCFFQFYVTPETENNKPKFLSIHVYMRSADLTLGIPFNIVSYSLLTKMIAKLTNLEPKELIITMGDCHIYSNQIDVIKTQITRYPKEFPKIYLKEKNYKNINDFTITDFILKDYYPDKKLAVPMIV